MDRLQPGHLIDGPALVDTVDTTLWAPAGSSVSVAAGRTLVTRFNAPLD
jgi:hypothetical protein